jgi:hypothetical protein
MGGDPGPEVGLGASAARTEHVFSRRAFVGRGLSLAGLAALAQLPAALAPKGLVASAQALDLDATRSTFSGLAAFVLPGDDAYSVAQGVTARGPGAVGANAVEPIVATLDRYVTASVAGTAPAPVPVSSAIALLLDDFALQVNPVASRGGFVSPFARLSFEEKAKAIRLLDEDPVIGDVVQEARFVSGLLLSLVAFMAFSDAPMYDPATRTLTATPLGWKIASYRGPVHGHPDFKGYLQGRRKVRG